MCGVAIKYNIVYNVYEMQNLIMEGIVMDDIQWVTINGQHIPIGSGQSKDEAIREFLSNKKDKDIAERKKEADGLNAEKQREENAKLSDTDGKKFVDTLEKTKGTQPEDMRWRVDVHTAKEYADRGCKLYTNANGSTVAVDKNGDIISVCKNANDERGAGARLLQHAVHNGGTKLDSFAGNHAFYTKNGFEPVSWVKFNREYAPDGWKAGRDAEEPVVFYKYVGKGNVKHTDLASFTSTHKPYDDYDEAYAYRDSQIKRR